MLIVLLVVRIFYRLVAQGPPARARAPRRARADSRVTVPGSSFFFRSWRHTRSHFPEVQGEYKWGSFFFVTCTLEKT